MVQFSKPCQCRRCSLCCWYCLVSSSTPLMAGDSIYVRGIQTIDKDGVASFETTFPGHYDVLAHLLAHMNIIANGTGTVTHIGQLFENEVLRSAVEGVYPYNTNTQSVTCNADVE